MSVPLASIFGELYNDVVMPPAPVPKKARIGAPSPKGTPARNSPAPDAQKVFRGGAASEKGGGYTAMVVPPEWKHHLNAMRDEADNRHGRFPPHQLPIDVETALDEDAAINNPPTGQRTRLPMDSRKPMAELFDKHTKTKNDIKDNMGQAHIPLKTYVEVMRYYNEHQAEYNKFVAIRTTDFTKLEILFQETEEEPLPERIYTAYEKQFPGQMQLLRSIAAAHGAQREHLLNVDLVVLGRTLAYEKRTVQKLWELLKEVIYQHMDLGTQFSDEEDAHVRHQKMFNRLKNENAYLATLGTNKEGTHHFARRIEKSDDSRKYGDRHISEATHSMIGSEASTSGGGGAEEDDSSSDAGGGTAPGDTYYRIRNDEAVNVVPRKFPDPRPSSVIDVNKERIFESTIIWPYLKFYIGMNFFIAYRRWVKAYKKAIRDPDIVHIAPRYLDAMTYAASRICEPGINPGLRIRIPDDIEALGSNIAISGRFASLAVRLINEGTTNRGTRSFTYKHEERALSRMFGDLIWFKQAARDPHDRRKFILVDSGDGYVMRHTGTAGSSNGLYDIRPSLTTRGDSTARDVRGRDIADTIM
jgi:hypothetical protein